ncbi:MAG: phosphoribosylaminoimidazolesuccinocarboxamide synthase [Chloroflexus sp.]|uniref:phosphoribosylaminoimidazolesuccinocarboxamide synthase n=1 Tax=Chloroflexus sp. TaxID=1904827 RepID=UPI004048EE1B
MELGYVLTEGKTKIVYAHPTDPDLAILYHKDGITAGDGARRSVIEGKGEMAGKTTANVFRLLNRAGIATHFIDAPEPRLTVVRRCTMIPLEVVMRRLPAGSYLRRHPEAAGQRFDPPLVEFFLKDDAHHDPQIAPQAIIAQGIATHAEVEQMTDTGRKVFVTLEAAWQQLDVTMVDLKIEFGRAAQGDLLVADVIDNDSWRIWPSGDPAQMLDKQVYRDAQVVDDALLADVRARYALVTDLTSRWEAMSR